MGAATAGEAARPPRAAAGRWAAAAPPRPRGAPPPGRPAPRPTPKRSASSRTWARSAPGSPYARTNRARTARRTGGRGPGAPRPSQPRNHSRAPGRRCSTIGATWAAPAAAAAGRSRSSCAGVSVRHGRIGAISTPQRSPASFSAAHASRRRCGAGCPARPRATASSSTKPTDTFSPTSVTSAASSSRSRSRRISVPLVRIENGLRESRSARDDPAHQPVAALGPLVAVDVGAHRDVLARPARRGQLRGAAARAR